VLRIGEAGAEREQIALDLLEHAGEIGATGRCLQRGPRQAERGIGFVDVAIRGDTHVRLRDTHAAIQTGFTAVAGPGIDFHGLRIIEVPTPRDRQRFRRRLLDWYRQNGRDLPWRKTNDPYHILVSEVMLQQTQVDRVLPKYHEWLEKYPSLQALADARETDVAETWRPLGYNIRPRRLHAIARESVERYGGQLPSDEATLRSFKGIGEYTAGAVLSFAFGQRAAILDTNVARVLFRVFVGRGKPKAHAMKKFLWDVSRTVLPHRHVFDFNQALMDFGATLCTAKKPKCLVCPMRSSCRAYPFNPENEQR